MADIELTTLSDADKLALAGALGSIVVRSGEITSPVAAVRLGFPAGYYAFQLIGSGLLAADSGASLLAYRLSFDGGMTYEAGETDYFTRETQFADASTPTLTNLPSDFAGMLLSYIDGGEGSGNSASFSAMIHPGSAGTFPTLDVSGTYMYGAPGGSNPIFGNKNSTGYVTAVGRATHIEFAVYYFDDIDLAAGTYQLIGFKK